MLKHYIKVTFRNLWKYRFQTIASVFGLAIGFVYFALSALWIRYETNFDSFHKDADRIYLIQNDTEHPVFSQLGFYNSEELLLYLKETFPEVEGGTLINHSPSNTFELDGVEMKPACLVLDSFSLNLFDIELLQGSADYLIPENNMVAITQELVDQEFEGEELIGKKLVVRTWVYPDGLEFTVGAVVKSWTHTNYPFQVIIPLKQENGPYSGAPAGHLYVKLRKGVDVKAFETKLNENKNKPYQYESQQLKLCKIQSLRYNKDYRQSSVKFHHIILFSLVGGLIILCSLFNYFNLFLSRFSIRRKEISLRLASGASGRSLFFLFSTEVLVTLGIALLLGMTILHFFHPVFQTYSDVQLSAASIFVELLVYMAGVIVLTLLISALLIYLFRKQAWLVYTKRGSRNRYRRILLVLQLIVSIGFIFCTAVMMKQFYHMQNTDIGFDYKNTATLHFSSHDIKTEQLIAEAVGASVKTIPEITESVAGYSLMPQNVYVSTTLDGWADMPSKPEEERIGVDEFYSTNDYLRFYNFRLIRGRYFDETSSEKEVIINESLLKQLGDVSEPIGKKIRIRSNEHTVVGVVKDIYYISPTKPVGPAIFTRSSEPYTTRTIIVKYMPGTWETVKHKLEEVVNKYGNGQHIVIVKAEDAFRGYIKSEDTLMKILVFAAVTCLLVAVFGFVSLVSLNCEERRREIAIRKVNGARIKDILFIFLKDYFILLLTGAFIAFLIGYYIMQRWIEQYVEQTSIPFWIYLAILLGFALLVFLSVGWKVYRTSKENPAEVLKSE